MGSVSPFKVLIVGAGLGGLSCAIACRREGLDVLILEKAPAIAAVRRRQTLGSWTGLTDRTGRCWDTTPPKCSQDLAKLRTVAPI